MKKDTLETKSDSSLPSIAINGHYIKELHLDNSNSPGSFVLQKESPKIEIAVNFNNRNVQENTYEVVLLIKARAKSMDEGNYELFDIKLSYAGLVSLNNVQNEEQKEAILMVHFPSVLFPYARRVISDITRDAGFQPLNLEHIDFASLHSQRKPQKEAVTQVAH